MAIYACADPSLHAAFCGKESKIISSDAVIDRLGLNRIPFEPKRG